MEVGKALSLMDDLTSPRGTGNSEDHSSPTKAGEHKYARMNTLEATETDVQGTVDLMGELRGDRGSMLMSYVVSRIQARYLNRTRSGKICKGTAEQMLNNKKSKMDEEVIQEAVRGTKKSPFMARVMNKPMRGVFKTPNSACLTPEIQDYTSSSNNRPLSQTLEGR